MHYCTQPSRISTNPRRAPVFNLRTMNSTINYFYEIILQLHHTQFHTQKPSTFHLSNSPPKNHTKTQETHKNKTSAHLKKSQSTNLYLQPSILYTKINGKLCSRPALSGVCNERKTLKLTFDVNNLRRRKTNKA